MGTLQMLHQLVICYTSKILHYPIASTSPSSSTSPKTALMLYLPPPVAMGWRKSSLCSAPSRQFHLHHVLLFCYIGCVMLHFDHCQELVEPQYPFLNQLALRWTSSVAEVYFTSFYCREHPWLVPSSRSFSAVCCDRHLFSNLTTSNIPNASSV